MRADFVAGGFWEKRFSSEIFSPLVHIASIAPFKDQSCKSPGSPNNVCSEPQRP